mmetsp:Transcript_17371/g.70479  ORF Transcript_17371/g.70479 Transcript_17371/m.70479 type:complete len:108 (-) Transcript_17371:881-1204(-)
MIAGCSPHSISPTVFLSLYPPYTLHGQVPKDDNFLKLDSGFSSSSYGAVWSENELRTLVRGHRSYGKKWDRIAKMLPGRLPSTVKHRLLELKRKDPDLFRKLKRKKT